MIKECAKRKLIITTFALLVFFITLSFPKTEDEIKNVENELAGMIDVLTGDEFDMKGLSELKAVLSGE